MINEDNRGGRIKMSSMQGGPQGVKIEPDEKAALS